jgi:hypothetical protein
MFILRLLCGIYHGPKQLAKHSLWDFQAFLYILLVRAIVNKQNNYKKYPPDFSEDYLEKILFFLKNFQFLEDTTVDLIVSTSYEGIDIECFFVQNYGTDFEQIIVKKYQHDFYHIISEMFRHGFDLKFSRTYTSSIKKWVITKMVYSIMSTQKLTVTDHFQKMHEFAIHLLNIGRKNPFFILYSETIIRTEFDDYDSCIKDAIYQFKQLVFHNLNAFEEWQSFCQEFSTTTQYRVSPYPTQWTSKILTWIMNFFQNHATLQQMLSE